MSPGQLIAAALNPLGLALWAWLCVVLFKVGATALLDLVVDHACKASGVAKLPSRVPVPIMKGLHTLQRRDFACLAVNQFVETAFLQHLCQFVLESPLVERSLGGLTVLGTVGAFYAVLMLDDAVYYCAHRAMHLPALYPLVHKHHHRQSLPRRGYWDAANEHPVEQLVGLSAVWVALHATAWGLGGTLHAAGVMGFFTAYAVLAGLNHTPYDVKLGWLAGYTVRAHEMHHRMYTCNYAQNTMIYDRLFGTFREYSVPKARREL